MPALFRNRGFSLLEMLVYISILVVMLVVIMSVIVSIARSGRLLATLSNIDNSAANSLERIVRETRRAESVDLDLSILGSNPGRLALIGADESGNPRRVEFYLSSGALMFSENGVEQGALSQDGARISSLIFYLFSSPNAQGIRTEMTIESGTDDHYRSNRFYVSALLR